MRVATAGPADHADWLRLRVALWPHAEAESPGDIARILGSPDLLGLIARDSQGHAIGFAEVSLRRDYVEGCDTSPVGFLEGIFVMPDARGQGVARALTDAAAEWAKSKGCSEFASNALLDNIDSHRMHQALGFEETERVVFFRKWL